MEDETKLTPGEEDNNNVAVDPDELLKAYNATLEESAEKDAEIARLTRDRDNYREGLLAERRKGGYADNLDDEGENDLDAKIQARIDAALKTKETSRSKEAERKRIVEQLVAENKRLQEEKLALVNKPGKSVSGGANKARESASEVPDNYGWTKDQLAYFKEKGLDPKEVRENMGKVVAPNPPQM